MPNTTHTVLQIAKKIFEAEKPEDRAWNRNYVDPVARTKKPLSEAERESFYRRARKMLGLQGAKQ